MLKVRADIVATFRKDEDYGLCKFTCPRGCKSLLTIRNELRTTTYRITVCPSALCIYTGSSCPTGTTSDRTFSNPTKSMAIRAVAGQFATECYLRESYFNPENQSANCGDNQKAVSVQVSEMCN